MEMVQKPEWSGKTDSNLAIRNVCLYYTKKK